MSGGTTAQERTRCEHCGQIIRRGRKSAHWTFELEAVRPLIGQTDAQIDDWPVIPDQVSADLDSFVGLTFPIFEDDWPKRARLNPDYTVSKI